MLVEESETAGGPSGPGEVVQPGRMIREATPRLVRDAFGPLATFFVGWKLFGLTVGIFLAVAFGTLVFVHERRQGRPAALVRVAMVIVCIRAVVGLSSGSATVYLAQEIGIDILLATVVLSGLAHRSPDRRLGGLGRLPVHPRDAGLGDLLRGHADGHARVGLLLPRPGEPCDLVRC